ncbi:MAG: helix-turn-helix domain-containing protein [Muribaculaceae bacterium]|nr:helix-turn-helix domain-containing protein [Muribaculaceae bacterium]
MELVDRLKIYMEHIGLPISQFADTAQIPRPTLSQILSGRNRKISNELLEKLHSAFPRLNVSWLLFGDGEMEINGIPQIVPQVSQHAEQPKPQPETTTHQAFNPSSIFSGILNSTPSSEGEQVPHSNPQTPQPTATQTFQSSKATRQASPENNISLTPDLSKKIQNIIVFYNDNSFEIFSPSAN